MESEKIKITRKEIDEIYDIQDPEKDFAQEVGTPDEITVTEVKPETWEEMTERKDKDNKWLSE